MILKGRSMMPPEPKEYIVKWNGTMDRQGTCFQLTGRIDRHDEDGTDKSRGRERTVYKRRPVTP